MKSFLFLNWDNVVRLRMFSTKYNLHDKTKTITDTKHMDHRTFIKR